MRDLTVIVPAKYEAENISSLLDGLSDVAEVIVVSPTDASTVAITELYGNVTFHEHNVPGKGEAMRAGMEIASNEYIMCMDADGSHDPAELSRAWDAFELGASVVKGSRYLGGSSDLNLYRSLGNRFLTAVYNVLYRQRVTDLCYGFIGATREVLDKVVLDAVGFEIEAEFMTRTARAGYRVEEFPSYESDRMSGLSNLRPIRDGFRILYTIVRNKYGAQG